MRVSRAYELVKSKLKDFKLDAEIELHMKDGMYYAGCFETDGTGRQYLTLNVNFIRRNNYKIVRYLILHEIAHAIDFNLSGGWRINSRGKIKSHDLKFRKICKILGIPGARYINEIYNIKMVSGMEYVNRGE